MDITGLLLYNITRGISGQWIYHRGLLLDLFSSADSSSMVIIGFFETMDSSFMISADSSSMVITGFFGSMD
jgi:hypothetical protein